MVHPWQFGLAGILRSEYFFLKELNCRSFIICNTLIGYRYYSHRDFSSPWAISFCGNSNGSPYRLLRSRLPGCHATLPERNGRCPCLLAKLIKKIGFIVYKFIGCVSGIGTLNTTLLLYFTKSALYKCKLLLLLLLLLYYNYETQKKNKVPTKIDWRGMT